MLNNKLVALVSIFILFFVGIIFVNQSLAQESKFYHLSLIYSNGNVSLKDIIVLPGDISQVNPVGNYKVELLSLSNASLYKTNFDIPISVHGEEFDYTTGSVMGKETKLDTLDLVLNVPYFPNGKEIEIYDPDNKQVLKISVAHFAEVTPSPSPSQEFNPTKAEKGNNSPWIFLGIFIAVLIGLIVFIYLQFKRPA